MKTRYFKSLYRCVQQHSLLMCSTIVIRHNIVVETIHTNLKQFTLNDMGCNRTIDVTVWV